MKRKDFKSGMILTFEEGRKALLLDDEIFFYHKGRERARMFDGSLSLTFYNETTASFSKYKLQKVEVPDTPKDKNIGANLDTFLKDENISPYKKTVWIRPKSLDIQELTLKQVCDRLGYEVKIIKEE